MKLINLDIMLNTDKEDIELSKEDQILLCKALQNLLHLDFQLSKDEFHRACDLYCLFDR